MTQFILAKDRSGHQIVSQGLTARQMLGQNSPLLFSPCKTCGAVLLAMLQDVEGVMVTGEELRRGYKRIFYHPDAHKLYKIWEDV